MYTRVHTYSIPHHTIHYIFTTPYITYLPHKNTSAVFSRRAYSVCRAHIYYTLYTQIYYTSAVFPRRSYSVCRVWILPLSSTFSLLSLRICVCVCVCARARARVCVCTCKRIQSLVQLVGWYGVCLCVSECVCLVCVFVCIEKYGTLCSKPQLRGR